MAERFSEKEAVGNLHLTARSQFIIDKNLSLYII